MSSPGPALESSPRRLRRAHFLRFLAALAVVAALGLGASAAVFFYLARAALPQLEGTLQVQGLSQRVTVMRDVHGVPHIHAATLDDLFFAQGFVTAQDRLWQMDMLRRYAAGELSEVLGASLLDQDRRSRTLQLNRVAERAAAALPEPERSYFEAYARGVNAYIAGRGRSLPVEFRVLRYQPRPWTPQDSILVATYMSDMLAGSLYLTEVGRERILAQLGEELTSDLYPTSSWRDRVPSATSPREFEEATPSPTRTPARRRSSLLPSPGAALELEAPVLGSNNWVVSGEHTVSGRPLLSNDMHLPHQIPGIWYRAHLQSGDFDVTGFTLPGLPFIVVGHNRRIAWGFTNLGPDVQDVFIENFNAEGEYLTADGWAQPERRQEIIRVRRQPDVSLEVVVTRNGPIITSLIPEETRPLALKWTLYEEESVDVPFFQVNAAGDWEEFRWGFARLKSPAQNVVYADVDGNIGYQATGRIPVRGKGAAAAGKPEPHEQASAPPADGSLPVPANDPRYQWTDYVPFEELPSIYNPRSGILATANGRVTPRDYPHHLGTQWSAPYRTERIYRVLESGKKFSSADMLELQLDVYSELDRTLAERFVYAVDRSPRASARAREAADLMREWDGRLTEDAVGGTLAAMSRLQLTRLLLEPRLGELRRQYRWFMSTVWLENTILRQPPRWLPEEFRDYDALLVAAVEAAVSDSDAPGNLARWRWGSAFPLEIQHPILGRVPLLRRSAAPGVVPQGGSGNTVKAAGRRFGASQRMTVDLGDLDATTMNIVTGQSGQLLSPHYLDHWPAWHGGSTFPAPFTQNAVQRARQHTLILQPAP